MAGRVIELHGFAKLSATTMLAATICNSNKQQRVGAVDTKTRLRPVIELEMVG
ncbi:MAG: hypothetical protein Kow00121_30210 [Elainellaceae cyanobacterium]